MWNGKITVKYGNYYSISNPAMNFYYPNIFTDEVGNVIDETKNVGTLELSEQLDFVTGYTRASEKVGSRQTYYYLSNSDFSSKLEITYSNVLQSSTTINNFFVLKPNYWIASRCTDNPIGTSFIIRSVNDGELGGVSMFTAMNGDDNTSLGLYGRSLFPVVSLNASLIEGDATTGFSVK